MRFGVTQGHVHRFPDEERGVFEIGLCGSGDCVNVIEVVEAGAPVRGVPIKANDLDTVGNRRVGVAVERRVNDGVADGGAYSADVIGFKKLLRKGDRYPGGAR